MLGPVTKTEPMWRTVRSPVGDLYATVYKAVGINWTKTHMSPIARPVYIANGFDMKAGDEVLMSDQEHPGGEQPWNLRAKRYGIEVKKFRIPRPPKNASDFTPNFWPPDLRPLI